MKNKIFITTIEGIGGTEEVSHDRMQKLLKLESILQNIFNQSKFQNSIIQKISVIPLIFNLDEFEKMKSSEFYKFSSTRKEFESRLFISTESYKNADEQSRKKMLVDIIIKSLFYINNTKAKDFKTDELIEDFKNEIEKQKFLE